MSEDYNNGSNGRTKLAIVQTDIKYIQKELNEVKAAHEKEFNEIKTLLKEINHSSDVRFVSKDEYNVLKKMFWALITTALGAVITLIITTIT
jgi:tetrahydromethanopterin S-methyltransferase subunit G